jgi:AcrR family transcriptional regulator
MYLIPKTAEMSKSKAARSEATRAELERVARALFAARGFSAVSAEELVARASVTRGALYHHYGGKEGLFEHVVETTMRDLHSRLVTESAGIREPMRAIEHSIDVFLRACAEPETQRILLIDGPAVLGWPRWRELDARYGLGLLKQALNAAVRSGSLRRQDPDMLAHLLLGAMTEAAMVVARSTEPAKARRAATAALGSILESWRA